MSFPCHSLLLISESFDFPPPRIQQQAELSQINGNPPHPITQSDEGVNKSVEVEDTRPPPDVVDFLADSLSSDPQFQYFYPSGPEEVMCVTC